MSGLEELLVTNGGTLLTFAIFIGERIIQATKERKLKKQRIDDKLIQSYLEWLRKQDQSLLLNTIETKYDELLDSLDSHKDEIEKILHNILHLLDSDFNDLKGHVESLNKAIKRPVLSSIPLSCRDLMDSPLLERDDEISTLREIVGDLIVSGQPGLGKTFLLYHLSKELNAKFLVSHNEEDVLSYLQVTTPPAIIIDDAHDWLNIIERLIHFRTDAGKSFSIIATCWPFEEQDLIRIMRLSEKNLLNLSLLSAKTIAKIIKNRFEEKGYDVPTWLVREIREQAAGRPGLAIRLVNLLLEDGTIKSLKDGRVHFELIDRAYSNLEGVDTKAMLAAFAVGGKSGMNKKDVSSFLGIPIFQITKNLRILATGGIIQETDKDKLATIPDAFRHVLLREIFFCDDATSLDEEYWKLYQTTTSKENALITLLGAIAKGAIVAEDHLYNEMLRINSTMIWKRFAWINHDRCKKVIEEWPSLIEALAEPALYYIPEIAIPMLLEISKGDNRPLHSNPEAPLRKLSDWVTHYSLHNNDAVKRRRLLLDATSKWLEQGGDLEVAWKILPKCTSFHYESTETDPGDGRSFTIMSGVISLSDLKTIADYWMKIVELANKYPPSDWTELKSAIHDWLYPFVPNVTTPEGFNELTNSKATEVMQQLIKQPNLPRNALAHWMITNTIDIGDVDYDHDFIIFWPPEVRNANVNWRELQKKYTEDATALGNKWATQSPESVAKKLVEYEKERRLLGITWPIMGHHICTCLASQVDELHSWITTLLKYHVESDYLFPFLRKNMTQNNPKNEEWLSLALSDEIYCFNAINEILTNENISDDLFFKTWPMLTKYSKAIGIIALRGEISLRRLEALEKHESNELLLDISLNDFHSDKKLLLNNNRAIWLRMFHKGIKHLKELDSHYFYDIENILERVPEIRYDIASSLLSNTKYISSVDEKLYIKLFAAMETDEKIRLLPLLENVYPTNFTALLVGDDLLIYRTLLENDKLRDHHLLPLKGKPSDLSWQNKALLALDYGHKPKNIARSTTGNMWQWSGSVVRFCQSWIDEFNILLNSVDTRLQEIANIGKAFYEYEREKAQKDEKKEAIYGVSEEE